MLGAGIEVGIFMPPYSNFQQTKHTKYKYDNIRKSKTLVARII